MGLCVRVHKSPARALHANRDEIGRNDRPPIGSALARFRNTARSNRLARPGPVPDQFRTKSGDTVLKLEHGLVRYLSAAIEPSFDASAANDWRLLVSPRLRRMWPDIPLEIRCAMVESFQKLYGIAPPSPTH